jgi:ABC-type transporter Mla subunit MlaD
LRAGQPLYYSTELDTTGGLGSGDAITHAPATIGRVTGVSPISGGAAADLAESVARDGLSLKWIRID